MESTNQRAHLQFELIPPIQHYQLDRRIQNFHKSDDWVSEYNRGNASTLDLLANFLKHKSKIAKHDHLNMFGLSDETAITINKCKSWKKGKDKKS